MADSEENAAENVVKSASKDSEDKKEELKDGTELDDLLDSALEDFGKPAKAETPKADEQKPKAETKPTQKDQEVLPPDQEAFFNELFSNSASMGAAADFQNAFGDLMSEIGKEFSHDPQFNDELSKLLQTTIPPGAMPQSSASKPTSSPAPSATSNPPSGSGPTPGNGAASSPEGSEDDITRTLGETLQRLSQNAQELQQEGSGSGMPQDFMRAFEGMNMGPGAGDAELLPMMQSIMQNLLAKEVLYPSLKEVVGKYPDWLSEKKDSIPQTDYDRYSKQLDVMQRLCSEYEAETDSDSPNVKQQRTMRVMDLIQQMETLGQPPPEIVGDMGPGFPFDEDGNPRIPGMLPGMMPGMPPGMPSADQCSIM